MAEPVEPEVSPLESRRREIVLDIVLTWASIDVSLGYFAAGFFDDERIYDVAEIMGTKRASTKLHDIIQLLKTIPDPAAAAEFATALKCSKKNLRKYGKCRNHFAHSKCLGFYTDESSTEGFIFLKFENVDSGGLAQYKISVPYLKDVFEWLKQFDTWLAARIYEAKHLHSGNSSSAQNV